jgi:hypothetical protein
MALVRERPSCHAPLMRTKPPRCVQTCAAFLLIALVACATRSAPDPSEAVERSREFQSAAGEALGRNDLPGYLTNVADAAALRPHHPTLLYHLARAYVMNDSVTRGLATLERLAAMGIAVRPQSDSGFMRIWDLPAFATLKERFDANAAPTDHSTLAFALAGERAFLPEGVALDPRTGTFYVGSVHQQRIVRVQSGVAQPFANDVEFWSVMGMTVDTARNLLWAATSAVAERAAGSTPPPTTGKSIGSAISPSRPTAKSPRRTVVRPRSIVCAVSTTRSYRSRCREACSLRRDWPRPPTVGYSIWLTTPWACSISI